jgi:hypothetical protein
MANFDSIWSSIVAKVPFKALFIWLLVVFFGYYLISTNQMTNEALYKYSYSYQLTSTSQYSDYMPQAIVFIAMGKIARESLIEDSILSVRLLGHWSNSVVILTDKPKCFESLIPVIPNIKILEVPSKSSIIEIKTMKAEIFSYLPPNIDKILYMDVDILVTRNLGPFFHDLTHLLDISRSKALLESSNTSSIVKYVDFAAFFDAKGHYVGFCSGCEKWHTGVMYLVRDQSTTCLRAWASVLSSGRYNTDQESLDFAESNGSCTNSIGFPTRHLLFAKDYIGMVLTSGQTFIHLTSANKLGSQDYFYRDWVVPRIRNSLHPPLRSYSSDEKLKQC